MYHRTLKSGVLSVGNVDIVVDCKEYKRKEGKDGKKSKKSRPIYFI